MSWSITIPAVTSLDSLLGDKTLAQALAQADCGLDKQVPLPGGSLSLAAALKVPIELFNDLEDKDAGGVIGKASAAVNSLELDPLFAPDDTACWLKYAAEFNAQASGSGTFPFVKLSGGGSINVLVTDYRQHPPTRSLKDALGADAKTLRLPFVLEDVRKLTPGDALSFQARIALNAGVTLSWPAVTSTVASVLALEVGGNAALQIKASMDASVGAALRIEDDLRLVFSRPQKDGPFRVSVRKATTRDATLGVKVSVELEASSPLLAAILSAGANSADAQRVTELVQKFESGTLDEPGVQLATRLLGALGFKPQLDNTLASVKAVYGKLRTAVQDGLRATLKAGFEYEYGRCSEDTTLIELELPAEAMAKVHDPLISGDLLRIQRETQDAWIRRYFHVRTTEKHNTLALWLGPLANARHNTTKKYVVQHASRDHVHGPRRYAFQGARAYQHKGWLASGPVLQGFDFNAQMKDFSDRPTADAFEYSFFAQSQFEGTVPLEDLVDIASVWGVLQGAPHDKLQQLYASAPGGSRVSVRLELRIPPGAFRTLLENIGTKGDVEAQLFANALARALPKENLDVRKTPALRERVYAPLWKQYLTDRAKDWDKQRILGSVEDWLKHLSPPAAIETRNWEKSTHAGGGPTPRSFMGVMESASRYGGDLGGMPYGNVFVVWSTLTRQLKALQAAIHGRQVLPEDPADSVITDAFDALEDAGSNAFRLTATVAWFVELSKLWGFRTEVQAVCGVKVGKQDELVLSSV
ncbi:hypothetical protein JYK02_21140 [Corallococcus macrosporus]|uniref:Uncharacterized protein n=1 Tax=Corallococcus macrosporus TaxID=35 RepID=A0ABS3DEC9_9BACT|nr:hypothetical protein [Corallococcus macrosporus]MBN8230023.1 hypothetical protein [Corallococcus macrosporus]